MEVRWAPLPYLGSLRWYRSYMTALLEGKRVPLPYPKAERRCVIRSNTGRRLLTVPVAHGSRHEVAEHGNWRQVHLQAFMSEYGRCAYYPYLAPQIAAVVLGGGTDLRTINSRLHEVVLATAAPADTLTQVASIRTRNPERWHMLHLEKSHGEEEDLSVVDVLMRRGPEAIFTLVDAL